MRATRRGKVRIETVGFWRDSSDRHQAGDPVRVYRTPYTAQRARWDKRARPPVPPLVERHREELRTLSRQWWAQVEAGEITSQEHDRRWNEQARVNYRAELRTAEGLAYHSRSWSLTARYMRSSRKEGDLIRADRRDRTRVPALRAAYGRRRR